MCVIMLVGKTRPTEEMVTKAWHANKDGAGIAWREEGEDGEMEVVFEKGIMELDRIKELCATVPQPYTVHFRVASVGGVKPELTHPFPVSPDVQLELSGRTKGAVLFHNGHWGIWNEKVIDAMIHSNSKPPVGKNWSDSRAMAWMAHLYGPGFLDLLTSQKGVRMTPEYFHVMTGSGWERINDVWCSNDYFWGGRRTYTSGFTGRLCKETACHNKAQAGKDLCYTCEDKKKPTTTTTTASQSSTTGVDKEIGPFAKVLTMAEVETLYKRKYVSKSQLKKFKKANSQKGETGNRGKRAWATLEELSEAITEKVAKVYGIGQ